MLKFQLLTFFIQQYILSLLGVARRTGSKEYSYRQRFGLSQILMISFKRGIPNVTLFNDTPVIWKVLSVI